MRQILLNKRISGLNWTLDIFQYVFNLYEHLFNLGKSLDLPLLDRHAILEKLQLILQLDQLLGVAFVLFLKSSIHLILDEKIVVEVLDLLIILIDVVSDCTHVLYLFSVVISDIIAHLL